MSLNKPEKAMGNIEMTVKDVLIIGGGPAGMAAAISLKNQGISEVLIIEREAVLGGILPQCIHDGFGLIRFGKNMTGPEYADIYERRLLVKGISYLLGAAVTAIKQTDIKANSGDNADSQGGFLNKVTIASAEGTVDYLTKAVILATGCRERARGALRIPGTRPAGIYTAGTAQNFINLRNLMPGKRVVILGSGDIGLIMARRLTLEGAEVVAVIEKEKTAGGLPRNVKQCLTDFNIPLILGATITDIKGVNRISTVSVCDFLEDGRINEKSERDYPCDTLILSVGLIPEVETGLTAGITLDEKTGEPMTDEVGHTTVNGIFVCGNARYVHDLVDDVSTEAESLGVTVANYIKNGCIGLRESPENDETFKSVNNIKTPETLKSKRTVNRPKSLEPNTMICLLCPNSCAISYSFPKKLELDESELEDTKHEAIKFEESELEETMGKAQITGAMCGKGVEYVQREMISPMRTLTSSVSVLGGEKEIVSVRTTSGIPKGLIFEAMEKVKALKVAAPVEIGQIVEKDFMTFGVDLIATSKVL